ncbi:MAG: type IV pilus assembly protein PilM [Patescibacteria group bacterium]|nr:type IV pilus assembly protein PilM [Patescibacteria group bacterium]
MFHWPRHSVVGIDVSDRTVEAVLLKRKFGKPWLAAYSRQVFPAGMVENGRILKPSELAECLRALLRQAKPEPIRERLCVLCLPESQVFSHVFAESPVLANDQVRRAILLEAEQFTPIPLRESYYDFLPLGKAGDAQEVYYVATRRSLVHQYLEVFRSAGILPIAFEPESASLARSLTRRGLTDRGAMVLLLDVGARTTNAHLVRQGTVVGSLTIPRAGSHFTAAVATALKLKETEAEEKKIASGFDAQRGRGELLPTLVAAARPIVEEIKRYIAYAEEHRSLTVQQVILAGGSALLPGFPEYLAAQLGLPVTLGNPLQRVRLGAAKLPERESVLYGNVIGLALRGLMRDPVGGGLNLLSQAQDRIRSEQIQQFFTRPKLDRKLIGLMVAFGLSLAVLAGLVWFRYAAPSPARRAPVDLSPVDWQALQAPRTYHLVFSYGTTTPSESLSGRLLEGTFTVTGNHRTTGTTTATLLNAVSVRLVNERDVEQPLVLRTRLQSADGSIVRLPQAVVVPADSTLAVEIPLAEGAVPPNGRLRIPGLRADLQDEVYGEVLQTGTGSDPVVTADDLTAARLQLQTALRKKAQDTFVPQAAVGEYLLPFDIPLGEEQYAPDAAAGAKVVEFSAALTQSVGGLVTSERSLQEVIAREFGITQQQLESVSYQLEGVDLEQRQIRVIITSSLQAVEK